MSGAVPIKRCEGDFLLINMQRPFGNVLLGFVQVAELMARSLRSPDAARAAICGLRGLGKATGTKSISANSKRSSKEKAPPVEGGAG